MDTLAWDLPDRLKRRFELRRGDAVIATLAFDAAPNIQWEFTARHPATAETDGGTWRLTVVRRGFLGLKSDVHVEGTNEGVLEASYFLRRGRIVLSQMNDHQWRGNIAEYGTDRIINAEGAPVLELASGNYFDKVNAQVTVPPSTTTPRDVVLLASLGLYVRLLMNKTYK